MRRGAERGRAGGGGMPRGEGGRAAPGGLGLAACGGCARHCGGAAGGCRKLYPPAGGGPGGRRLLLETAAPRPVRPGPTRPGAGGFAPVPCEAASAPRRAPLSAGTPATLRMRGRPCAQLCAHPLRLVGIFPVLGWGR